MSRSNLSDCLLAIPAFICIANAATSVAGIDCPCQNSAVAAAGVVFACPAGDGDNLAAAGLTVTVTVRDCGNQPVVGIPANDIWLIGCDNLLSLCGGPAGSHASAPTDENGQTTITGPIAAGGCGNGGVRAVVQGVVVGGGVCADPCIPIKIRSADFDGNLVVGVTDFAFFTAGYPVNPAPNDCRDFDGDGQVGVVDFAKYVLHEHSCGG